LSCINAMTKLLNFDEKSDSLKSYSFGISHKTCIDCISEGLKIDKEYLELQELTLLSENPSTDILLKEIKKINRQTFSILGNRSNYPDCVYEFIEARTIFNGEKLRFSGQRRNKKKSEFVHDIYTMLNSIELN
jgi:hypothetical protein